MAKSGPSEANDSLKEFVSALGQLIEGPLGRGDSNPEQIESTENAISSVAKGFLTLHRDSDFSMKDQKGPDKPFSTYASLDRETKKHIKNPDKSWSRVENHNLL